MKKTIINWSDIETIQPMSSQQIAQDVELRTFPIFAEIARRRQAIRSVLKSLTQNISIYRRAQPC